MTKITEDIYYVGVNDHQIDLFEGQFEVPLGMAYNSYIVMDDLITIFDTVDVKFFEQWMNNVKEVLGDKKPSFLVIQHMEPDHSANIMKFLEVYPNTFVVGNTKTFKMIEQFFHKDVERKMVVDNLTTLNTGKHTFTFYFAAMIHWPEVMMAYDSYDKTLFSADAFGKFGALDKVDPEGWDCEARRYYFGIVGKYGVMVQAMLKQAINLDIKHICSLHGPVLGEEVPHVLDQYNTWSSYAPETDGVAIFYTSVYGHTKEAANLIADFVKQKGAKKVAITDLAREDMYEAVEDAFRYSKIILLTTTYNMGIYPFMREFIDHLLERNYQNKVIGVVENGSWAPAAGRLIKEKLAGCNNVTFVDPLVTIVSSLTEDNKVQLEELADKVVNTPLVVNKPSLDAKPEPKKRKWVCKVCGYVYEGYELPKEFACPLCKHPASDFEEVK